MIKNIIFDLGGVIITLSQQQAIRCFRELGLADADRHLDAYTQTGIFGRLEEGAISEEDFRRELSSMVGRELSWEQCAYAWQGYALDVPKRNLSKLLDLRSRGYRVILLSNTNPFMMSWVDSGDFDGLGHGISYYVDSMYLSYKLGVMKPSARFFSEVLRSEAVVPAETLFVDDGQRNVEAAAKLGIHTFCPVNGEDWTSDIEHYL